MEQSYWPLLATPVEELETPCLIVDLDALEHNIRVMADYYRERDCKLRPHAKNNKCPQIAHMQIRAGGTVGGVCVAKVAEAEVMVQGGIPNVLIANQIVTKDKIARLCALVRQAEIIVACDDARNARDLSEGVQAAGVTLGVVIEVETGNNRCGVRTPEQGVELARVIQRLPGLRLLGVMSHESTQPIFDREERFLKGREMLQHCLDVRDALEGAGIPVEIVSSGETWTYDVAGEMPGVTEVQAGTYLLMDGHYTYMMEFRHAVKVLSTVISMPRPGVAIGDAGIKAMGTHAGMPVVEGMPGVTVTALHDEHTLMKVEDKVRLAVGDKFTLIPGQQDTAVDRWDRFIAVRLGKVEAVWDIMGRGCHN